MSSKVLKQMIFSAIYIGLNTENFISCLKTFYDLFLIVLFWNIHPLLILFDQEEKITFGKESQNCLLNSFTCLEYNRYVYICWTTSMHEGWLIRDDEWNGVIIRETTSYTSNSFFDSLMSDENYNVQMNNGNNRSLRL